MEKAFELLIQDHRQIAQWIDQLTWSSTGRDDRVFSQLSDALEAHTAIEEEYVYPPLQETSELKSPIRDAYSEHTMIKNILGELAMSSGIGADWDNQLKALKENIDHHVQEEERVIFAKAPQVLDRTSLANINNHVVSEKQRMAA
jgi:iron-sulfur cluster repair protein YtfE (RIC family)